MKKLLTILLTLQLSGCALYDIYFMANFDSVEYSLVNRIRTLAETKDCTPKNVESLYITSLELKNYSQYIPRNARTISMTTDLHKIVEELHKRDKPSAPYCQGKLNIITTTAERIQQVTGTKPR